MAGGAIGDCVCIADCVVEDVTQERFQVSTVSVVVVVLLV